MIVVMKRDATQDEIDHVVERVAGLNPQRKVFCVTIYPHVRDLVPGFTLPGDKTQSEDFRRVLTEAVATYNGDNAILIPGPEILDDPAGLTADLVHPSDFGMTLMARNLAKKIARVIR